VIVDAKVTMNARTGPFVTPAVLQLASPLASPLRRAPSPTISTLSPSGRAVEPVRASVASLPARPIVIEKLKNVQRKPDKILLYNY